MSRSHLGCVTVRLRDKESSRERSAPPRYIGSHRDCSLGILVTAFSQRDTACTVVSNNRISMIQRLLISVVFASNSMTRQISHNVIISRAKLDGACDISLNRVSIEEVISCRAATAGSGDGLAGLWRLRPCYARRRRKSSRVRDT